MIIQFRTMWWQSCGVRSRRRTKWEQTAAPPAWPCAPFCSPPTWLCLLASRPAWPVPLLVPPPPPHALPASARTFAPAPCLALPASNPRMLAPPPPLARLGFVSWCFLFFLSGLRKKGWIRKGTNVFSSARFNFFCLNLEI
jgi:hypothetical protein